MANDRQSKYDLSLKGRYRYIRNAAKRRNKAFDLTIEQFAQLIEQNCHYCEGHFPKVLKSIGLDRIDNSLGYISGNVLPCCETCNRTRSDLFSIDETKQMIQLVIKMRTAA